ncbi:hypothetical protein ACFY2M_33695 [Streptomyces sp. NPDC001276]|uniref:hypothetical protein n=1 Tax=Streptomyces sp. NPDC001276 TaxID=3364555 RepID=UPI0036B71F6D
MSTLPRLHHEHNASVTLSLTDFTASGSTAQVAEFLTRVCEALSALPLDGMEREAGVLAAEGAGVTDPTSAELLSFRYGTVGAGLASWDGPGPDRIPADAVRDAAARYFHADNAVLVLTGPPPAGLRLPLPRAPRPDRGRTQPVLKAGQGEYTLCLDAREGQEQRVAELLWQEALRTASAGVTEEELAEELTGFREVSLDPRSASSELGETAACLLLELDYQDAPTRLDALARVTPEQAGQAFTTALATALLVVPCHVEAELRRLDGNSLTQEICSTTRVFPPDERVFKPSLFKRTISSAARAARLGVDRSELWCCDADDDVHHVPFDEVVGVEMRGTGRVVFGSRGCFIPVVPELWAKIGPVVSPDSPSADAELRQDGDAPGPLPPAGRIKHPTKRW